jgi:hypothetical protein
LTKIGQRAKLLALQRELQKTHASVPLKSETLQVPKKGESVCIRKQGKNDVSYLFIAF